jgi:hypothetical protein
MRPVGEGEGHRTLVELLPPAEAVLRRLQAGLEVLSPTGSRVLRPALGEVRREVVGEDVREVLPPRRLLGIGLGLRLAHSFGDRRPGDLEAFGNSEEAILRRERRKSARRRPGSSSSRIAAMRAGAPPASATARRRGQ